MNGQREKLNDKVRGYPKAIDLAYNDPAGALRTIPVYPRFNGYGTAIATAQGYDKGSTLGIFNSDSAIHYVATGAAAMGAPSGPTNGIPVPAGQWIFIHLGDDTHVRADNAAVYAYKIDDDSRVVPHTSLTP